jgi:hypothetical protein
LLRVAAAAVAAIIAAVVLALDSRAGADQTSPFPSPSPVVTEVPGSGGYAVIGFAALSASGGSVPSPAPSSTPMPFSAARASGFSIELVGRLSPLYAAEVRYDDANIHNASAPIDTRFEAAVLRDFGASHFALGVGYTSVQRSTDLLSSNGLGFGAMILPNFARRISPYASLFLYPNLPSAGTHATLSALRLGIAFSPSRQNGIFEKIGFAAENFGASGSSPTSLAGVEFSLGTSF